MKNFALPNAVKNNNRFVDSSENTILHLESSIGVGCPFKFNVTS